MSYNPKSRGQTAEYVGEIFDKYGDFIRKVLQTQVSDRKLADDIFQEFFLSMLINPPPEGTVNMKSYIYRAVMNDIHGAVRAERAYRKRLEKIGRDSSPHISEDDPANDIIAEEQLSQMRQILRQSLSKPEADAVELRYFEDLGIGEAAEQMSLKRGAVSMYLHTALKKIRRIFDDPEEFKNERQ